MKYLNLILLSLFLSQFSVEAECDIKKIFVPVDEEFLKAPESHKLAYLHELAKTMQLLVKNIDHLKNENKSLKEEVVTLRARITELTSAKK